MSGKVSDRGDSGSTVIWNREVTFEEHRSGVYVIKIMSPEILISAGLDDQIGVYDIVKNKRIMVIKEEGEYLNDLLIWNHEKRMILVCSDSCFIKGYKFSEDYQEYERWFHLKLPKDVSRMLKVSNDLLIATVLREKLHVINMKETKVEKLLFVEKNEPSAFFAFGLSKKHSNCFYFSNLRGDKRIKLINYQTNELVRSYGEKKRDIKSFMTYINSNNSEIIICGDSSYITFLDSEGVAELAKLKTEDTSYSFILIPTRNSTHFLMTGDMLGSMQLYRFEDSGSGITAFEDPIWKKKGFHDGIFYCMQQVQENVFNPLKIASSGDGSNIHISTFICDQFSYFDDIDEVERREFLKCDEESRINMFSILLMGTTPLVQNKVLLLL